MEPRHAGYAVAYFVEVVVAMLLGAALLLVVRGAPRTALEGMALMLAGPLCYLAVGFLAGRLPRAAASPFLIVYWMFCLLTRKGLLPLMARVARRPIPTPRIRLP